MMENGVVHTAIKDLPFGESFKLKCREMGFNTISEILNSDPSVLPKKDGFDYHWLAELGKFMNNEGLLHLLQPITENTYGSKR